MSEKKSKVWFPAKTAGWGWGLPIAWQGWVVFALFLLASTAGALLIQRGIALFLIYETAVSAAFVAVCWFKGENPGRTRERLGD